METLTNADVFFIISSIGTMLFMVLMGVILYQIIKILRLVRTILERVEAGSERLAEDLDHLRAVVAHGGIISRLVNFFLSTLSKSQSRSRRSSAKDN